MSRIAKSPVELPKGVEFKQNGNVVTLKGGKGELSMELNSEVELTQDHWNHAFVVVEYGARCD